MLQTQHYIPKVCCYGILDAVDLMLNLGDILYGPIAPKATYDLLMQHDFITICGNIALSSFSLSELYAEIIYWQFRLLIISVYNNVGEVGVP